MTTADAAVVAAEPADAVRGLSTAEVRQRAAAGLANDYRPRSSRPVRQILATNVFTRFNALLGSLLVVILIVGPLQDALFGLALVANTLVGIVQELRAKRALDRLSIVTAPTVRVVRDGLEREVDARDVVVDDVVRLAAGDQVVVDAVLIDDDGLQVDESLLSGESHALRKTRGDTVLSGSAVVAGSGTAHVTAVGASAYAAQLETQAREFSLASSEIRDGINRILQVVTWVLVPTAALLIWSQFARSGTFADAVRASVAGTVTMVPEGLVLLTSVAFAVGALRLARRGVLARELAAVEGLARVDVLCIDKTGTLTTGRLRVDAVTPLAVTGDITEADIEAALGALARLESRPNATSRAIADRYDAPAGWSAVHDVPFTSARKWSGGDFGARGCWALGAPEVLCPSGHELLDRVETLAQGGARVLLLVRAASLDDVTTTGRPVALVTLFDELRTDAPEALDYLAKQGVTVRVLSGDHPATVATLAARVGLDTGVPLDARTIADDDASLRAALRDHLVWGRVTPAQKQRAVQLLRADGRTVAMTGDGVNDILALRDADIGIAMGSGAAATRAVAQLVLLRDSFTAVPAIIGEGRRVIANMERVANLFITKTVYAAALAIGVGVARLPFPFLPRHLTVVSTLTIGVPAFILALAPNARRARPHFVARVARFAVPAGLVAAGGTYLAYAEAREDPQTSLTAARTLATMVLLAIGLWVLSILVRLGDNRQQWMVPTMAALFVVALAVPATRAFFALQMPRPLVLLAGVGAAALSGVVLELGWRAAGWLRPRTGAASHRPPEIV